MECKFCGSDTHVTDKRNIESGVRRRRECVKCRKRFTTYERTELNLMVIKKDGRKEPYNRDKLSAGIQKACEKRPVSPEEMDKRVDEIENDLRTLSEISSKKLGEMVMKKLLAMDKVAYLRFASVYRSFSDVKSFEKAIKAIKSR